MLQFITSIQSSRSNSFAFQYISCCSLSSPMSVVFVLTIISIHLMLQFIYSSPRCSAYKNYFNTSHVVVYRTCNINRVLLCRISIHLMLQFIKQMLFHLPEYTHFNTSHVVVYPIQETKAPEGYLYFNTSHVVVYHLYAGSSSVQTNNFNTSHVVVYLIR